MLVLTVLESLELDKTSYTGFEYQRARVLIHSTSDLCELWHKRMAHLHHGALNILKEIVTGLLDFRVEQQGVCKGCALGKYAKATFLSNENKSKGI